ncbi:uncharacterized protein LOC123320620 [Coccinella septempunctata]|uniref:uncharacterized protein LOC123320620 n=1 Tax=Coccinella septempunctata TaxID=41139 RepID=UPI001D066C90|nr:uncharacterized protein LOC123320620 [Coccinella septempunctata]
MTGSVVNGFIYFRREDRSPTQWSLICSCHFINGDKNNLPSLFKHNEKKLFTFQSPERKKRRNLSETKESQEGSGEVEVTSSITEDTNKDNDNSTVCEELVSVTETGDRNEKYFTDSSPVCVDPSLPGPSNAGASVSTETQQGKMPTFSGLQEAELYFLKKENETLKRQLQNLSNRFSFEVIKDDNKLVNMYTGLPTVYIFDCLYDLFENLTLNYTQGWTVGIIPKKDQLLLTLMKLRLNLLHNDLACRFNCSQATVSNIISTWVYALHEIIFLQLMGSIPSRIKNKQCMTACFSTFTNCRIVLDCTEVKCIKPSSLEKQKSTYSSYKHQNTVKGLIGVAPNGVITFVSDLCICRIDVR